MNAKGVVREIALEDVKHPAQHRVNNNVQILVDKVVRAIVFKCAPPIVLEPVRINVSVFAAGIAIISVKVLVGMVAVAVVKIHAEVDAAQTAMELAKAHVVMDVQVALQHLYDETISKRTVGRRYS